MFCRKIDLLIRSEITNKYIGLSVLWVMLLAWIFLRKPITVKKWGGILLGAVGAVILILGSGGVGGGEKPFLAYICIMIGQKRLRPTLVGMYNYVQPIVATITGICLGLDVFTPLKGLAILLIFSGVWLVTISKAKERS